MLTNKGPGRSFRFARRGLGAIVCGLGMLAIGFSLGIPEATTAGMLTLGAVVVAGVSAIVMMRRSPGVTGKRVVGGQARSVPVVGDELPIDMVLRSTKRTGQAELVEVAIDDLAVRRGARSVRLAVRPLKAGSTSTASYRVILRQRGLLRFLPAEWKRSDPLGLTVVTHRLDAGGEIVVAPAIVELAPSSLIALAAMTPPGVPGSSVTIDPFEIREIRPHVVGEDLRRIHWPTSARRNMLMVREPERTRTMSEVPLVVVCDTRLGAHNGTLELALSTAASVVFSLDGPFSLVIESDSEAVVSSDLPDALRLLGLVPREPERGPRVQSAHSKQSKGLASLASPGHVLISGPLATDSGSLVTLRAGQPPLDSGTWTVGAATRTSLAIAIDAILAQAFAGQRQQTESSQPR
jgi:Protein of unknown function DUF58